ncbi:hypothetical protein KM043_009819 [Ampulex compressa]|nr:hypothetical protein KM043_009819 [Ampulex compressa]
MFRRDGKPGGPKNISKLYERNIAPKWGSYCPSTGCDVTGSREGRKCQGKLVITRPALLAGKDPGPLRERGTCAWSENNEICGTRCTCIETYGKDYSLNLTNSSAFLRQA